MMDEKKVREAIYCMKASIGETMCEECVNYYKCDHTKMDDMMRTAIEALEKQLPKKPIDKSCVKDNDTICGYVGICPSCNGIVDDSMIVCDCTQVLDWSENRRVEE